MSRIALLVDQLKLQALDTAEKYNQTAVLPLPSYYLLCGLAEYLRIPRSRLSGMLLSAAIEDAIAALPEESVNDEPGQSFATQAEYVRYLAWREQDIQEVAEAHLAKQNENRTK